MRFFFYGTLCDADVRRKVIGPGVDRLSVEPATLPGYECVLVCGRTYPVLREREGAVAEGVLVRGLDAAEAARIDRFETGEYRAVLAIVSKASGGQIPARIYFAARPDIASDVPWKLEDWQRRHKRVLLRSSFE
jgi:gamma-glutamylcyclotransferase (GGCT)/AIG2-like uncharacterized protein YtfP